jgi:hypothetical protein
MRQNVIFHGLLKILINAIRIVPGSNVFPAYISANAQLASFARPPCVFCDLHATLRMDDELFALSGLDNPAGLIKIVLRRFV